MCFFRKKKKPAPPPPKIVIPAVPLMTGVSVFGNWPARRTEWGCVPQTECTAEFPWETLRADDRKMSIMGAPTYDERDPAVTRMRDELWTGNAIDFACYQVQWSHGQTQHQLLPPWICKHDPLLMRHCPDNHAEHLRTKFCLSNWDVMATSGDRDAYFSSLRDHWTANVPDNSKDSIMRETIMTSWRRYAFEVSAFMKRANYLRVGDRPVLLSGAPEGTLYYARKFSITPRDIDNAIRSVIKLETGADVYRVATSVADDFRPELKAAGFDAMTEYLLHGMSKSFASMHAMYEHYWANDLALCKTLGIDYIVPASAGYDSRAWGSPVDDVAVPTAAQFEEHLRAARRFAKLNHAHTRGMIIAYAWNEIGEGGIIEPMMPNQLHSGDEILRAFKSASLTS